MHIFFNWKLNPATIEEAIQLFSNYPDVTNGKVVVLPPTLALPDLIRINTQNNKGYEFGIQDSSSKITGAFTGQNSPTMAASLGIRYSLIGHSEARTYLGVSDQEISQKVTNSINAGLTPIIAVGHDEGGSKLNINTLTTQVIKGLKGVMSSDNALMECFVAFEPVWAIGTGSIPANSEIQEAFGVIIEAATSINFAGTVKLLYGGSVNESTIRQLMEITNLSGFLVGGASLSPEKVQKILL